MRLLAILTLLFSLFFTPAYSEDDFDEGSELGFQLSTAILSSIYVYARGAMRTNTGLCPSVTLFVAGGVYYGLREAISWEEYKDVSKINLDDFKNASRDVQLKAYGTAYRQVKAQEKLIEEKKKNAKTLATVLSLATTAAILETSSGLLTCNVGVNGTKPNSVDSSLMETSYNQLKKLKGIAFSENDLLIIKKVFSAFIPSSMAAMTKYEKVGLLSGASLMAAEKWLSKSMQESGFDQVIYGAGRTYGFGIFAGVAWGATSAFHKNITELETRAEKYKTMYTEVQKGTSSEGGLIAINNGVNADTREFGPSLSDLEKQLKKEESEPLCAQTLEGQLVPVNCNSCKVTDTCTKTPTLKKADFPKGVNPQFMSQVNNVSEMFNQRFSGNTQAANLSEGKLAQYAARIRKQTDSTRKQWEKLQQENGKEVKPFERMKKEMLSALKTASQKAFANITDEDRKNWKDYSDMSSGNAEEIRKIAGLDLKRNTKLTKDTPQVKLTKDQKDQAPNFNFDLGEESGLDKYNREKEEVLGKNDYEYDKGKAQIVKNQEASIFQIVTLRYYKTAYPLLLTEKKE